MKLFRSWPRASVLRGRLKARWSAARLLVVAGVLIAAAVAGATFVSGSSARSAGTCGRGVPEFKCNPGGPVAGPENHPTNVTPPAPYWPSDATVSCNSDFFSTSQVAQLESQFGSLSCFRFDHHDTWVLISDGMQPSGDGAAVGGAIVGTETCSGQTRSVCLDASSTHDFADFTVSYAPDPAVWPMRLQATFGSRLIYLGDGACGPYAFDLNTLRWFGGFTSDIDSLLGGTGAPRGIAAPTAVSGSQALSQLAPAAASRCSS